jgi:hypothetical protein
MKVKIMQRSVYHKIAIVEIEIPDTIKKEDTQPYLIDNEDLYVDKIDEKMEKAEYEFGFGTDYDSNSHYDTDFNERDQESEWRYEIAGKNYGGHL